MKHSAHKAVGGLIRIALDADELIKDIRITGDFFIHPEEAIEDLEKTLMGVRTEEGELLRVIKNFYAEKGIEAPGIEPEDLVEAIRKAV
jgi:hypothetical protein